MTAATRPDCDVLVVGAGPTGLSLASELGRHGVICRVVERDGGPAEGSRALGLAARTLEFFRATGVADAVVGRARVMRTGDFHADGRHVLHVVVDASDLGSPYPFLMTLPQDRTERILADHVAALGVAVDWRTRLERLEQDADGVTATLADEAGAARPLRCRWLVGCDGAHSTVRHALGLSFAGAPYEDRVLTADLGIDWSLSDDGAHVFLTREGTVAAFPFPEPGRWRLIQFGGELPEEADIPAAADRFGALVAAHAPGGGTVHDVTHANIYKIHRRIADRLRVGRCFVAGDAAHIHSPVGGQGLNTGVQDAFNLAWKLALAARGEASEALLDSYQAERHPVAETILHATDRATRLVEPRGAWASSLRDGLLGLIGGLGLAAERLPHALSDLTLGYPDSPVVGERRAAWHRSLLGQADAPTLAQRHDFGDGPGPGRRAPDVVLDQSAPRRLFDLLYRDLRHTLLLFASLEGPSADGDLGAIADAVRSRHGERVSTLLVGPPGPPADRPSPALADPDGRVHRAFGAAAPCLYLIRPDGYVGYRSQPPDLDGLLAHLGRIFA